MPANNPSGDQMRLDAEWMSRPADDQILSVIREEGNMTPLALSRDGEQPRIDIGRKWAGERCRELAAYGLLRKLDKGLFAITDVGIGYLDETVDASELDRVDG